MPQFWWVNHNQTARQEIDGQYLWSPKTESNGARSQFYQNMRRATPGDLVLSYSQQAVRYIGRVTEFAFTAPKPEEFGARGANWSQEGWLLPVYWVQLSPPISPRVIIGTLAPLLPERHSPIQRETGYGNQKAYLASVSEGVFTAVVASAAFNPVALERGGANSLTHDVVSELLEDSVERQINNDLTLADTVRRSLVLARRGQGTFRANVERVEGRCRLTGITNPALLIASHIKPWRLCQTAEERLDGNNGLLLSPDADHLFDRGFITFGAEGNIDVSPRIEREDLRRLGFDQLAWERFGVAEAPAVWGAGTFTAGQHRYIAYHRAEIFIA